MADGSTGETIYPLSAIRALALHCQGLLAPPNAGTQPDPDAIYSMIQRIGWVQIDTLQVVQRSQYLVLWSRLGCYDASYLDRLTFGDPEGSPSPRDRRLFEYWMHAACLVPLEDYRLRLPTMRRYRERTARTGSGQGWLDEAENAELVESVMERVWRNGPVRAADFENTRPRRGSWWDWKPAKRALEHLFDRGDLMVADRINFQRVYDTRERVLPDWVDSSEPTEAEANRRLLERSMRALGVASAAQVAGYCGMTTAHSRPLVGQLLKEGTFLEVRGCLHDGAVHTLILHRDNLPLLDMAAHGELAPRHTTFLSPFDNLFWARGRDMQLWGFRQVLEAYKPEAKRIWGYFCMPILHRDSLVGRFDPKLDRRSGTLRLKALYLEPQVPPEEELVSSVAGAMRDFMAFHGAGDLVIERSEPPAFGEMLLSIM